MDYNFRHPTVESWFWLTVFVVNTKFVYCLLWEVLNKLSTYSVHYKYLPTSFVRFLVLQAVTSINLSQDKFRFVPLQDFTANSDIDWNMSVAEIDQQLYDKYGLTDEERTFIESMIKPME